MVLEHAECLSPGPQVILNSDDAFTAHLELNIF
jgi:hypothetical protein